MMKEILAQTLHCQCETLEDCGAGMSDHPLAEKP
jgi:hypothetical protein